MASLLRASLARSSQSFVQTSRRTFATETPKNKGLPFGNAPLYLSTAGLVGLSIYLYSEFPAKPNAAPAVPLTSALNKDNWKEFSLKKIEPYNHNTTKFTFALPENTATLLPTAACVMVKPSSEDAPKDKKGNPIARPYTPISDSDAREEVAFLIKKYPGGKVTPYLFDMKVGDKVDIKGPFPKHPYKVNEFEEVALIAGGSGITPMYQILKHAFAQAEDKTKFKLIFSNVSSADILLKEEFDTLKKKYPSRFETVYVIDKPEPNWTEPTGYITADLLKASIPPPSLGDKVKVFVCGPPGQVAAVSGPKDGMKQGELGGVLKELGYTKEQVYKF